MQFRYASTRPGTQPTQAMDSFPDRVEGAPSNPTTFAPNQGQFQDKQKNMKSEWSQDKDKMYKKDDDKFKGIPLEANAENSGTGWTDQEKRRWQDDGGKIGGQQKFQEKGQFQDTQNKYDKNYSKDYKQGSVSEMSPGSNDLKTGTRSGDDLTPGNSSMGKNSNLKQSWNNPSDGLRGKDKNTQDRSFDTARDYKPSGSGQMENSEWKNRTKDWEKVPGDKLGKKETMGHHENKDYSYPTGTDKKAQDLKERPFMDKAESQTSSYDKAKSGSTLGL